MFVDDNGWRRTITGHQLLPTWSDVITQQRRRRWGWSVTRAALMTMRQECHSSCLTRDRRSILDCLVATIRSVRTHNEFCSSIASNCMHCHGFAPVINVHSQFKRSDDVHLSTWRDNALYWDFFVLSVLLAVGLWGATCTYEQSYIDWILFFHR